MHLTRDGKQRRSKAEWAELVGRCRQSGLSLREFARQEKIPLGSLQRWNRRLTDELPTDFVDVTPARPTSSDWQVELELPGGLTLRLRG